MKWEDDAKEKGIAFGRSRLNKLIREQSKLSSPQEPKFMTLTQEICSNKSLIWVKSLSNYNLYLNTTYYDFIKLYLTNETEQDYHTVFSKLIKKLFRFPTNTYRLQNFELNHTIETNLLKYFIEIISPTCICWSFTNSESINPFLSLIIPLSLQSSILYYTIISISARQLSLLGNNYMENLASSYLSKVFKSLPGMISSKLSQDNITNCDEVLATLAMLCFMEITSNCGNFWLIHLNGAKQFLNHNFKALTTTIGSFVVEYVSMQEVFGETVLYNSISNNQDYGILQQYKYSSDDTISILMGCSPSLLSIIYRITTLAFKLETLDENLDPQVEEAKIIHQRNELELSIANLKQVLPPYEFGEVEIVKILKISEIKRLTTLMFLLVRIDMEHIYRHRTFANDIKTSKPYTATIKNINNLSQKIMELFDSLSGASHSLLWTLFIIGVASSNSEDQRWWVLNKLEELEHIRHSGNVRIARFIVETVWKEKDLNFISNRWLEMLKGKFLSVSLA